MQLNVYLYFNGQCEAAFKFYEKVLGGKIEALIPHAGTPAEAHVPPWGEDDGCVVSVIPLPVNPVLCSAARWLAAADPLIQQIRTAPLVWVAGEEPREGEG